MSFFGLENKRHDSAAPGFSQAHDPFASLSGRAGDEDDALEFEDTYDGLGDQLDETDDAFNDDTFGGGGDDSGTAKVGKDFDFFGQTAKVAGAFDEEHVRYNRQQPAPRAAPAHQGYGNEQYGNQGYGNQNYGNQGYGNQAYGHQGYSGQGYAQDAYYAAQKPIRSGYEKYKDSEPMPDLHVDQSIWGIGPAKTTPQPSSQQQAPPQPSQPSQPPAGRKVMSLEEVEAAMRAQPPKSSVPEPASREPAGIAPDSAGYQTNQQPPPQQHHGHGHPVTILQRPQSMQSKATPPQGTPATAPPHQQHHQQAAPIQPTQILQNPNRMSGDAARTGHPGHQANMSQGSIQRMSQLHAHPQMSQMSEEERAAFLDQETKRAKRNHKIWLLSKHNGVMTPQDKNFITRIQLQQLVTATGNPVDGTDSSLNEDFYYQVYSHIRAGQRQNPSQPLSNFAQTYLFQTGSRHGGMRGRGRLAENHFQRMEQQVQRAVEAAKNKPKNPQLVIAGSLGKISFSNAKTPKPLLNIKRPDSENRPSSGRRTPQNAGRIDRKTVLRNVEKVYGTLMKIEDHVRHIPPLVSGPGSEEAQEKHQEWAGVLEAYKRQLWDELKVHEEIGVTIPHPFIAFLSCAKGKKAIPRIFPHLNFQERTTILTLIIFHLDQLDVVQEAAQAAANGETALNSRLRENIELFISTVMSSLMQYFNDTPLHIVDGFLSLVATKLNVDVIAKTRIGVSMVTLILSRAVLLKQTGAGSPEEWENWDRTFETLFNKLEPSLPHIFSGSVNTGEDVYVWQLLAAMGVSATHDQQTRLVLAVKDRVLDTVTLAKTLPPAMAADRLGSVNLFMRSIGLDVELLQ